MFKSIWKFISLKVVSPCKWEKLKGYFNNGKYWDLTEDDWGKLIQFCAQNHYVILTRRKCHLSTYFISLAGLFTNGKFGYWSHAFLNLEGDVRDINDFKFIEAIGKGVVYSSFREVFDCDSVCLLRPRLFSDDDWTKALERAKEYYGTPYDTLFDLLSDKELSCVELVRDALKADPNYVNEFKAFEAMIVKAKNLTPDMFYNCKDFEVILEIRR